MVNSHTPPPQRVLVLGGTGTIGRATLRALAAHGHEVVAFVRSKDGPESANTNLATDIELRFGDVTDLRSLIEDGVCAESFDAVISCLASRTGVPRDAWAIDCQANLNALAAAKAAGASHFVLLSAICVQKPLLGFQQAKLAFERELIASGLTYSIVRPTAFFKSLSGQIERIRKGKPFLVFGDGRATACKPISDDDLGRYLATCLTDAERQNRILPIGGPGPAITPRDQGEALFKLIGREPRFKRVPIRLLDGIIFALSVLGKLSQSMSDKAELARIGRYYARESMLVLNPDTGLYDAEATPSSGEDTLFEYYARVVSGEASVERGDHSVF